MNLLKDKEIYSKLYLIIINIKELFNVSTNKKILSFAVLVMAIIIIIGIWQMNYHYPELTKEDIKIIESQKYQNVESLNSQISHLNNDKIISSSTTTIDLGDKTIPLIILKGIRTDKSEGTYQTYIYLIPEGNGYKADVRKNGVYFNPNMKPVLDEFKFEDYIVKTYLGQKSDNLIGEGIRLMDDGGDLEFVIYPEKVVKK